MSTRQDFTTYAEVDASGRITVMASSLSIAGLLGADVAYVYKDFGAGFFSSDFEHTIRFSFSLDSTSPAHDIIDGGSASVSPTDIIDGGSASSSITDILDGGAISMSPFVSLWALSNAVNITSTSLSVLWNGANGNIVIVEINGGIINVGVGLVTLSANTNYWFRICRDLSTGTNGTFYCYIYSNVEMTELVEVITLPLVALSPSFQYLFAFSERATDPADTFSGIISYLTFDPHPYSLQNAILLLRTLLDEATPRFFSDAQLISYTNDAQEEIASLSGCIRHIDPAATALNTRTVALNGNKVEAVEYVPGGSRKPIYLPKILPTQVGHVKLNGTDPQYWFEHGNDIGIEPLPDGTYNLNLYIEDSPVRELSALTQAPEISRAFQPLMVPRALEKAFLQDRKMSPAAQMFSVFFNELGFNIADKLQNVPDGTANLGFE